MFTIRYINLKNFVENDNLDVYDIFNNVPNNVVICLNENNTKILEKIQNKNSYRLDCSDDWKIKLVNKTDVCFGYSNNIIFYKYEYHGEFYENLINGNLINNSPIKYCKCVDNDESCLYCSNNTIMNNSLCIKCNQGYYEKENDNTNEYKECFKNPIGYYLDINESVYKRCYFSCEKCEIKGNNKTHNCLECNDNYPVEFKIYNNYSNCFQNCSYYFYFDEDNNYYCTSDNSCPDEYPILEGKECKKNNKITNIEGILKVNCSNSSKTKEEEIKYYDTILKDIEDIYTSKNYDTSDIDNGKDEIIETEKMKIILTTSENQKNNINNNMTNIDLGDCEKSLRRTYNLSDDEKIYIKMLEVSQEEMRIPKIEYDIYSKLNGENLIKLSLNSCQNNKISLLIPVNKVDNIDKLNTKSDYYNDFCYTTTSDNGTDITLEDRKNEYPSKAVCQDGCDFNDY